MTTSLVTTFPIVVYERDWSRTPFESLTMEEKIQATIAKREKLSKQLSSIVGRMSVMTAAINESTEDNVNKLIALRTELAELEELRAKHIRANQDPHSEDDFKWDEALEAEFDKAEQDFAHARHKYEQSETQSGKWDDVGADIKKKLHKIKKLWQRIAHRTHPDRTKDTELHKLFIAAKEYYVSDNLEGLERIWKIINGKASSILDRLLKRLHDELQELEVVQKMLDDTLKSEDYELMLLFERNKVIVLSQVNQKLEMQLAMLRQHRNNLRLELGLPAVDDPFLGWFNLEFRP